MCWGQNRRGQSSPPHGEAFSTITSAGSHTCALRKEDGTALCWGSNVGGVEGYAGQASPPHGVRFLDISAGDDFTCGLKLENGAPLCWGAGFPRERPIHAPIAWGPFSAVSTGGSHTCAITQEGEMRCWGDDREGQASPPKGGKFAGLSSGSQHTPDRVCRMLGGQ